MKKSGALLLLLGITFIFGCKKESETIEQSAEIKISAVSPSMLTIDHTSEGFLITLNNGDIIHFYRLDEGTFGGHVGNGGKVVSRKSSDNGMTWGSDKLVYSDEFDNRNVRGGITDDGTIIVFFRRYNAEAGQPVDLNYIMSQDDGNTWTPRQSIDFNLGHIIEVWIDNFIRLESNKYLLPVHGVEYCELRYFSINDGSFNLTDQFWNWDYASNHDFGIDEPSFTLLENGKIIGLFRDETIRLNYYQVTSSDLGQTWTEPKRTNICEPFFSPSPLIQYDADNERLIVVGTDRRKQNGGGHLAEDSKVWIYSNEVSAVFNTPDNYTLIDTLNRPDPSGYVFYGYPAMTLTKDNQYLVVFTESYLDAENEDADLYQFYIYFE